MTAVDHIPDHFEDSTGCHSDDPLRSLERSVVVGEATNLARVQEPIKSDINTIVSSSGVPKGYDTDQYVH